MLKKVISLLLVTSLVLGLSACKTSNQATEQTTTETTTTLEENATTEEQSTEITESQELMVPGPTKKDGPLNIAFIPASMNTYYSLVLDGINEEIDRYGGSEVATVTSYAPSSEKNLIDEQISIMETLLQQSDLDAVFFSTHNDNAFLPYLEQFVEKGIPVFFFNMPSQDVSSNLYVSLVAYDFEEAGRLCGEWVANYAKDKEVKMLYLEGITGTHNTVRMKGFMEGIANSSNIEIVASQVADWSREGGQRVTENVLQSNPEINLVFGPYDEMPLGAIVALKDANRLDDVTVVGYDLTEDGYQSILKGEMSASVNTAPKQMGNNLIDAAVQYCLEGKTVEKQIFNKLVVYDATNIDQIPADNYGYSKQEKSLSVEK